MNSEELLNVLERIMIREMKPKTQYMIIIAEPIEEIGKAKIEVAGNMNDYNIKTLMIHLSDSAVLSQKIFRNKADA